MSLVTTPVRALAVCVACASTKVTSITMTLTDDTIVDFTSCHRCEHKGWTQAGEPMAVSTVLARATKIKAAQAAIPFQRPARSR